jgi:uncharacterized protein (TIGR00251 family)
MAAEQAAIGGMPWRRDGDAIVIDLKVVPNARAEGIVGLVAAADGRPRLQLRIKAPPVDGKANAAVIRLLAGRLGCPRGALAVTAGATARLKRLRWAEPPADAAALLLSLLPPLPNG